MKPKLDPANEELARVLEHLLAADIDITAREVSRNHASLHDASAFTRSDDRMKMISDAQGRQAHMRTSLNPHFVKAQSLSSKLAQANDVNDALDIQVKALTASHAACIQAVMKAGGLNALERFWRDYKAIGETARPLSMPAERAEVISMKESKRGSSGKKRK